MKTMKSACILLVLLLSLSGCSASHENQAAQQTREEYFADIEKGRLNYFTIGIMDRREQIRTGGFRK